MIRALYMFGLILVIPMIVFVYLTQIRSEKEQ